MLHYRNYSCYNLITKHKRISNTVEFYPHNFTMTKTSSTEKLTMVLTNLLEIPKQPQPATPFLDPGTDLNKSIWLLATSHCCFCCSKQKLCHFSILVSILFCVLLYPILFFILLHFLLYPILFFWSMFYFSF